MLSYTLSTLAISVSRLSPLSFLLSFLFSFPLSLSSSLSLLSHHFSLFFHNLTLFLSSSISLTLPSLFSLQSHSLLSLSFFSISLTPPSLSFLFNLTPSLSLILFSLQSHYLSLSLSHFSDKSVHREPGRGRHHHRPLRRPLPVPGRPACWTICTFGSFYSFSHKAQKASSPPLITFQPSDVTTPPDVQTMFTHRHTHTERPPTDTQTHKHTHTRHSFS